jgi:hypothetical protein
VKWFIATTESGTEYRHTEEDSSLIRVVPSDNKGIPQTIKAMQMAVVPAEVIATWINENEGRIDWEWVKNAPPAEVPVVGQHLMVYGLRDWRLSTPIVKVEEK